MLHLNLKFHLFSELHDIGCSEWWHRIRIQRTGKVNFPMYPLFSSWNCEIYSSDAFSFVIIGTSAALKKVHFSHKWVL